MLNLDRLKTLINGAFSQSLNLKEHSLSLVIGNTGSGKSTLVNYLLGHQFKQGEEDNAELLGENAPAKMGDSSESITLYPTVYLSPAKEMYCDCPGFMDTRCTEEKICTSVALEMAVNSASKISSILVVIDYSSFTSARGESIQKLSQHLGSLIKNPDAIASSIFFVITKAPHKISTDNILSYLDKLIMHEKKNIESLSHTLKDLKSKVEQKILEEKYMVEKEKEIEKICRTLVVLNLMRKQNNNICLANLFDQGESRYKINNIIKYTKPINKEIFDFNYYDSARLEFNEAISNIMQDALFLFSKKESMPIELKESSDELIEIENKIKFHREQLKVIYQEKSQDTQRPVLLSRQEEKLRENKISQKNIEQTQLNLSTKKSIFKKQLGTLDVDDPVLYWKDFINEDNRNVTAAADFFGKIFEIEKIIEVGKAIVDYVGDKKIFNYSGIPFLFSEKQCDSGQFYREQSYSSQGKYSVTYRGKKTESCSAEVRIYVKKKLIPSNVALIENIKKDINDLELTEKTTEDKIKRMQNEANLLQKTIVDLGKNQTKNDSKMIEEMTNLINDFESYKVDLIKNCDKIKDSINENQKLILSNQSFYLAIKNIIELLGEKTEHAERQMEFLSKINQLLGIHETSALESTLTGLNNNQQSFFSQGKKSQAENYKNLTADELLPIIHSLKFQITSLKERLKVYEDEYKNKSIKNTKRPF